MDHRNLIFLFLIGAISGIQAAVRLDNEPELREAQSAIFNEHSVSGWLMLRYNSPRDVHFEAGGDGSVSEFKELLEDDQIQYGLVRLNVFNRGRMEIRDVFITWIGPLVGIIEKGKKTAFLGDVQQFLQPYHADVTVLSKSSFTEETLIDRSHPLSGSHVID